ncbi:hypothetical protein RRV45_04440 [Bacillus sp. DTU_2020_1000418_1_SI_GHA_SEK_038]|uniref:hypothetical protein n=1 Tax=Bacillus sp. DTU_2020_1000418_1_SI_GHA_SEK_038 TaxID=3077585 RepID=UPI0028EC9829|nr:hypothetical protein [Bacillus sp. DTU_2020_1000418_1_SI_GHA_SEK_038]WNS76261.1 hypothetical protein RRV45_04440 [Bacillus sp. DTU_2020_1000418_1_SI_GHA_SEK_038]
MTLTNIKIEELCASIDHVLSNKLDQALLKPEEIIQSIYQLETALMLSILFISFIQDSRKREHYLNRVHSLSQEIKKYIS